MFRPSALLWFWLAATTAYAGQNVVVVLDDSQSMSATMGSDRRLSKMEAAKQALLAVLENLPPDAKVGVVSLHGSWQPDSWVYPIAPAKKATLRVAIQGIAAGGDTPLGRCMKAACDALLSLRAEQHYGSYRLLIVTDGEATDGNLVDVYLPDILSRGIWVDVIGVDMARDHSLATRVHSYRKADDPASLQQAIAEVLAESAGDSPDAAESDFEVIAALPEGLAAAALQALSESGNHPIGEMPDVVAAQQPPVAPGQRAPTGPGFLMLVVIVAVIAGAVLLIRAAARQSSKKERTRW